MAKYPFKIMEVGDSNQVVGDYHKVQQAARSYNDRHGTTIKAIRDKANKVLIKRTA